MEYVELYYIQEQQSCGQVLMLYYYYYIVGFDENTFTPRGHFRAHILLFYALFWKITRRLF